MECKGERRRETWGEQGEEPRAKLKERMKAVSVIFSVFSISLHGVTYSGVEWGNDIKWKA